MLKKCLTCTIKLFMKKTSSKTLLISTIPTPVVIERYNVINQKLHNNLVVFFQTKTDLNRNWKNFPQPIFECKYLKNRPLRLVGKDVFSFNINPDFPKELKKLNPKQVILGGWDNFASYYAAWWCKKNNVKLTLWSGSTLYEKSWRRTLTKPPVKWLIRRCDDFISYGTRASEYLISLGAKKNKIQPFYNTVDIAYFQKSTQLNLEQKNKIKKNLGIKTKHVLMFNGQLIERKGIYELIDGFQLYQKTNTDISLLIVGSGREEEKIKQIIQANKIKNIFFSGFIQYNQLPQYYAISDLFILPSHEEVWGLVINEAMSCGLPIITNHAVGASVDLVKHGQNGYIMPKCTGEEIKNGIEFIFKNNLIKENNSTEIIQKFSLEKNINNLNLT